MTDDELDRALARADKATAGPWVARLLGQSGDVVADYEDNAMIEEITPTIDGNDAAFIAHARDDVPALVAEVRRLRALVGAGAAEVKRLQAEVRRLRGELEKAEEEFDRHKQGCW